MKKNILLLATVISIATGCKKDDDKPSATTLLTSGAWKITAATVSPAYDYNGDGIKETEFFSNWKACYRDNTYKFNAGGTGIFTEGAIKCDPADPQTSQFNWSLKNNDKLLTIWGESYEIVQLDGNTMKTIFKFSDAGIVYSEEFIYKH
jgi:hypothetical protein